MSPNPLLKWIFLLILLSTTVDVAGAFFAPPSFASLSNIRHVASRQYESFALYQTHSLPKRHLVDGIECVEVEIDVPLVERITILEATAESQEDLVNLALEEGDDDNEEQYDKNLPTQSLLSLNQGDPYGAVLWPAASAIASYIMTNLTSTTTNTPDEENCNTSKRPLEGVSVLELGAGTGLVSIAASLGGASSVLATDYEGVPLRLLEFASTNLNPSNTTEATPISTALLDLCAHDTAPLPPADLVVAADIMYEPVTGRAMARRAVEALQRGSRVLVGDSPGRAGRPAFLQELNKLGVVGEFVAVTGRTCSGDRHDLICGKDSSSVSESPKEMQVDVLDLDPATCFR